MLQALAVVGLGELLPFMVTKDGDAFVAAIPDNKWKELEHGLRMASLAKGNGDEGRKTRIVVFDIPEGAPPEAFSAHIHTGGEVFYVVCGEIVDTTGQLYETGDLVVMGPGTQHHPQANGRTVIIVCWPEGVELVKN